MWEKQYSASLFFIECMWISTDFFMKCARKMFTLHTTLHHHWYRVQMCFTGEIKNICDVCIFLYRDNSAIKSKPTSIWSLSKWLNIWFGMIVLCETAERKCDKSICVRMHAQLSESQHIAANWEIEKHSPFVSVEQISF